MPDPQFLFGPVPHDEAIDFIKSKPVVSREVFAGLLPDLQARAFTIAGLEGQANVMQAVRDRIAELPAGADWDAVKKDVANDITPFLVDPHADPDERAAQVAAADRKAEVLLRTHGFQAYQAAQFGVMDRQRDVLPFWQYVTMEDDRVRPEHAALDKIVLPADSPFWSNHFPPWDWGCRCQAVPISQWDRDDLAKADAQRPSDDKLVLEGPVAQHLVDGKALRFPMSTAVSSTPSFLQAWGRTTPSICKRCFPRGRRLRLAILTTSTTCFIPACSAIRRPVRLSIASTFCSAVFLRDYGALSVPDHCRTHGSRATSLAIPLGACSLHL
jgi:SPP1 gp7 family putative phage head morphogenesis protein